MRARLGGVRLFIPTARQPVLVLIRGALAAARPPSGSLEHRLELARVFEQRGENIWRDVRGRAGVGHESLAGDVIVVAVDDDAVALAIHGCAGLTPTRSWGCT